MLSTPQTILDVFLDYAKTFERLKPRPVLDFYTYPALLISPERTVAFKSKVEAWFIFSVVMRQLQHRGYDHSRTDCLSVRQLSDRLAIVSGIVIRYRDKVENKDTELERFGLTYTFQHTGQGWKITTGALHMIIE